MDLPTLQRTVAILVSSTRRPQRAGALDSYQTPEKAIRTLETFIAPYIHDGDTFLEPCRGNGNIVRVFEPYFVGEVGWFEITEGLDYLSRSVERRDWIITNPPFSLALEFLQKSLREADNVAYLLRLNFLGSQKRLPFWQAHPPDALLVLSERPCFTEDGKTDSTEYAWFIWSDRVPKGVRVR